MTSRLLGARSLTRSAVARLLEAGLLVAYLGVVYLLVVVGAGRALGTGGRPHTGLSIAATVLVAFTFSTVRERARRVANRALYGTRTTPYEALNSFSQRIDGSYVTDDVLPELARIVAEATRAARTDVWLRIGDELRTVASWPSERGGESASLPVVGHDLPPVPGADRAVPVRHQGELLGAVTLAAPARQAFTGADDDLVANLASQAGLVLRNVRLTAELAARLGELSDQTIELRDSRQRIVEEQASERRRVERNIHDGAQQHLVALLVRLRLACAQAGSDPPAARETVREIRELALDALATLADLSRGLYPRALSSEGTVAALEAQAARAATPTSVEASGVGRYPAEVEAAVYFCCLEAMQNAAKHAQARSIVVRLDDDGEALRFAVQDDGRGFDTNSGGQGSGFGNLLDRLGAVEGEMEVSSAPGTGTTVSGRVPLQPQRLQDR